MPTKLKDTRLHMNQRTLRRGSWITLVHLWCHQELLGGCLLVISTSRVVLVPRLARELQYTSDNATLFGSKPSDTVHTPDTS
jgi:hypothetical protein